MAAAILPMLGRCAPSSSAMHRLTEPATSPFRQAMTIASFADTLRVKLLSTAHATQAATTSRAPGGMPAESGFGFLVHRWCDGIAERKFRRRDQHRYQGKTGPRR